MNALNSNQGLVKHASPYSVSETGQRLQNVLNGLGITVFARIDHAQAASRVDQSLRPTETIIFGNPHSGTPFIQQSQAAAIDLPQKMVVWQDENDQVFLAYNSPEYIARRHQLDDADAHVSKVTQVLNSIATRSLS